jgi:hypothetical protein
MSVSLRHVAALAAAAIAGAVIGFYGGQIAEVRRRVRAGGRGGEDDGGSDRIRGRRRRAAGACDPRSWRRIRPRAIVGQKPGRSSHPPASASARRPRRSSRLRPKPKPMPPCSIIWVSGRP